MLELQYICYFIMCIYQWVPQPSFIFLASFLQWLFQSPVIAMKLISQGHSKSWILLHTVSPLGCSFFVRHEKAFTSMYNKHKQH